jgi:hypothetical protein
VPGTCQVSANVQIGKIRFEMTLREVKRTLGPPQVANVRTQVSGGGSIEYGWDFSTSRFGVTTLMRRKSS